MVKKAIVTGGSRGIGRGIAITLASEGYDIAFSFNAHEEDALQTADLIRKKTGQQCFYQKAVLQERGAGAAFFDWAVEQLGGLDVLVNNAGVTLFDPIQDLDEEKLDMLLNLDLRNYLLMMHYASKYMIAHGTRGSIVNITSSRGEQAYPYDGVYGGIKAALNRSIRSFALDVCEYGIRINNVAPGAIRVRTDEQLAAQGIDPKNTFWDKLGPRIPAGRVGTPEDIGQAVAFLVSDRASYITGFTLRVDGGLILPGMPEVITPDMAPGQWRPNMKEKGKNEK
jgi:NAD(P)-dependent dehydrogenase (short-subunit alcohol dehydrogenase family)